MDTWSHQLAVKLVHAFERLDADQQDFLIRLLNKRFPPSVYENDLKKRRQAQRNLIEARQMLDQAVQEFPRCIESTAIPTKPEDLAGYGIVLTAGGEGERLRLSLMEKGFSSSALVDFTKATFSLPDFFEDYGALHINLSLIAEISARYGVEIPVVVTTGPQGSTTDKVISKLIDHHDAFGIKHIKVICQGERLHLTLDEKIAYQISDGVPYPVTHPDETGGPIMKLKADDARNGQNSLEWFAACGANKIIVLQATAVYHPELITLITSAARNHDGLGVGILRDRFAVDDPFGSFVVLKTGDIKRLVIIEKEVRNSQTYALKNSAGQHHLPYNTGFYAFDIDVLKNNALPDYATPPKEVLAELPRSPKVGYAATDILALTRNPAVLAIQPDHYAVIKNADDLEMLATVAKSFGLDQVCRRMAS